MSAVFFRRGTLLIHRVSPEYSSGCIKFRVQCPRRLSARSYRAGCVRRRDRCGSPLWQWIGPLVALLDEATLLLNPTPAPPRAPPPPG
jgi:hypothetical protein